MPLRLFDSLSREVRALEPGQPDGVFRFYNCGLTVYGPGHIGNFRTFLVNDVIRRMLELQFGPGRVRHVRNLTDVDDKTIRRAREEGRPLAEVARHWTEKFHADCRALNCLPPHEEPRATDPRYLREQTGMIEVLLEKGHAYVSPDGSVYFKVASFPGYGALSRLRERELQPGAALKAAAADADEKEDGSDFALWKAWKAEDGPNRWPGPRGAADGRPGWHIECSAMNRALLGPTLDLHTGGVDLIFPHHENEIAQSECCNGAAFSRHWYHSEHLLVDGKKMSRSLGNFYTLDDLVAQGFAPMAVRYVLLAGHPRRQLNFTLESLHAAESALGKLRALADRVVRAAGRAAPDLYDREAILRGPGRVPAPALGLDALEDDLNVPAALGELFTGRKIQDLGRNPSAAEADFQGLARILYALGLDLRADAGAAPPPEIVALAEKRWAARQARDFAAADRGRAELAAAGWAARDGKDGYRLERLKKPA